MSYWSGKVVVITGASAGLGLHLSRAFADAGASVVMAARNSSRLQTAADSVKAAAGRVIAVPTDVTIDADVQSLVERALAISGRLDSWVNCAGLSSRGRAIDTSPDEFQRLFDVNLLAVVRCAQAAVPHLRDSSGHLVNVGSLSGKTASRYLGAYPASKFALCRVHASVAAGADGRRRSRAVGLARPDRARRCGSQVRRASGRSAKGGATSGWRRENPRSRSSAARRIDPLGVPAPRAGAGPPPPRTRPVRHPTLVPPPRRLALAQGDVSTQSLALWERVG